MKKLLFISLLIGIILNSHGQVINLSPDSTLYDLHLLPPGGGGQHVAPDFFAGGIVWVEGTDTTQFDSIYTSGTALKFESDGFLFSLDSIGTSGFSPEFQALVDAMDVEPLGDSLDWFEEAMDSLVEYGLFTKLEFFHWHAFNTQANAWLNWGDPGTYDITDPSTTNPTWTRYSNTQGDGSTDWLNSNWQPGDTTVAGRFNMTIGGYILNNVAEDGVIMGLNSSYDIYLFPRNPSDQIVGKITSNGDILQVGQTDSRGLSALSRHDVNTLEVYYNGASRDTEAEVSGGVDDIEVYILAYNQGGTGVKECTYQVAMDFLADDFTDQDHIDFFTIIERLADHLGIGVVP